MAHIGSIRPKLDGELEFSGLTQEQGKNALKTHQLKKIFSENRSKTPRNGTLMGLINFPKCYYWAGIPPSSKRRCSFVLTTLKRRISEQTIHFCFLHNFLDPAAENTNAQIQKGNLTPAQKLDSELTIVSAFNLETEGERTSCHHGKTVLSLIRIKRHLRLLFPFACHEVLTKFYRTCLNFISKVWELIGRLLKLNKSAHNFDCKLIDHLSWFSGTFNPELCQHAMILRHQKVSPIPCASLMLCCVSTVSADVPFAVWIFLFFFIISARWCLPFSVLKSSRLKDF